MKPENRMVHMKIRRIFTILIVFLVLVVTTHLVVSTVLEARRQLSELESVIYAVLPAVSIEIERELARLEGDLPLILSDGYEAMEQPYFNVRFLGIEKGASAEILVGETPELIEPALLPQEWSLLKTGPSEEEFVIAKRTNIAGHVFFLGVSPAFSGPFKNMSSMNGVNFLMTDLQGRVLWENPPGFFSDPTDLGGENLQESSSGWYVNQSGSVFWGKGAAAVFGQLKMYIMYPLRHILLLLFSRLSITVALELFIIVVLWAAALLVSRLILDPMDKVSKLAMKMQDKLFRSTTSRDLATTVSALAGGIREINSRSKIREVRVFSQTLSSALQSYVLQQEKLISGSEELASLNKSLLLANEALTARDRIWRRILEVSRTVTMDTGFRRGLELIAEALRDVTGAYGVLIGKLEGEDIHIYVSSGFGNAIAGVKIPAASGVIGSAAQQGSPVWFENAQIKGLFASLDPEVKSEIDIPMFHMGKAVGSLAIGWRTRHPEDEDLIDLLIPIAAHIGGLLNTHQALEELRHSYQYLTARMQNLTAIYHEETAEHLERMERYCRFIGTSLGFSRRRVEDVALFSRLHDIGKLKVPAEILSKKGPLDEVEFDTVKLHTVWGAEILGDANWLKIAKDICLYHHEKWDGSGYPFGKKGEEIPIEARIVALADTYDALRMQRSYKEACSHEQTCSIILGGDGRVMPSHFDPQIIEIYASHEDRMNEIYESSLETT